MESSSEEGSSDLRIGSVVIDCVNFDKMFAFWKEALQYVPRDQPSGGWDTNVSLNKVEPSQKLKGRNWLHFDLYTKDQRSEIRRLLKLGATLHPQEYEPEDDFVVLEDPDGNLFCVVDTSKR